MKENESKKTKEHIFFKAWLEDEDFKKWLSPAAENTHL